MIYRPVFKRASAQALKGRLIDPSDPERGRWLKHDVDEFQTELWREAKRLLVIADLKKLPTVGSRHNVFLAVLTMAAYRCLLNSGTEPSYARSLLSDIGWKVYSWLMLLVYKPMSLTSRKPQKKMNRTLKALMIFPFSAPGKPGYEVKSWTEEGRFYTHWTHCPPQQFVRDLIDAQGDRGELEAFYHSWCLYDWPAGDLLAGGKRGKHYDRPHTMSKGDSVCDMCWHVDCDSNSLKN